MRYWLMKSEPSSYSLDALKKDKKTRWEGVRNYQARNYMKKNMSVGDGVLFYHSNAKPSAVVGLAKVSGKAIADITSFDKKSVYYDPKSTAENPRWHCIELEYVAHFKQDLPLASLKLLKSLDGMLLLKKGMRLSIQPVLKKHFRFLCKKGGQGSTFV
ncbi:MAG: EVE domain-containing protein [Bdellovibrionaceae bacterium]|nr:EVE domain-containing protein [Pseudobdellovibrionaceae bacterium]